LVSGVITSSQETIQFAGRQNNLKKLDASAIKVFEKIAIPAQSRSIKQGSL